MKLNYRDKIILGVLLAVVIPPRILPSYKA